MSRWLPAVALGAILGLLAIVSVLALRPGTPPTAVERADALATELRCPDCQGLAVADSPTASAQEIRRQIGELVADGGTDEEVLAHFVARYGEWILLGPSAPIVWLIPFAVVLAAAAGLVVWLVRRRPAGTPAAGPVTAAERRRLHDEVEALDA